MCGGGDEIDVGTASMTGTCERHTATLLQGGNGLVLGGRDFTQFLHSASRGDEPSYFPDSGKFITMLSGPLDKTTLQGSSNGLPSMWGVCAGINMKSPGPTSMDS